ncbi:MAG: DUF3750 domain-containing protein [Rhizobiales bacterium]|nr:DUF3750 domain-containing protein [Hyphomicrobiales bacterium]
MLKVLGWFSLLLILVPCAIGTGLGYAHGWPTSWRKANWSSSGVLPPARASRDATVILLASRTGQWKSIFAEHMSIVVKPGGAEHWVRYDVVGWGNPVRKDAYAADAYWYGNAPRVIYRLVGQEAARLIPRIEASIARYPHGARGTYTVWPGPNSNTFVSWVVRNTEGFHAELPPVAVGKDWLGWAGIAPAPSKTGYTVSVAGLFGGTLATEEGVELHLLGSTIGVDFNDLAIKLPALGKLGVLDVLRNRTL